MALNFIALLAASVALQAFFMFLSRKYGFALDQPGKSNGFKHKTHSASTPRTGGAGLFLTFLIAVILFGLDLKLLILLVPCFLMGFAEDLRHDLSAEFRFIVLAAVSALSLFVFDAALLNFVGVRLPLWLAVPFTIFAFTGLANAVNIVDGINGLSSGILIMAFSFLSYFAFAVGDSFTAGVSVAFAAALAGFFVFNFPKGKVFMGDGGAYFSGFLAALVSALFVNRNPEISPWYPVMLFAYPITDTLFSIYRRKFVSGEKIMSADKLHLHILLEKRVLGRVAVLVILAFIFAFNLAGSFFLYSHLILIALSLCFAILYILLYRAIVKFKVHGFARAKKLAGSREIKA